MNSSNEGIGERLRLRLGLGLGLGNIIQPK
jgi:hypothetical protein